MDFLKSLNRTKLMILVGSTALVLLLVIILGTRMGKVSMAPLYKNLDIEDSRAISTSLQAMGVMYESSPDGSDIFVPLDSVLKLRMNLAREGLPSHTESVGYEIFDKSNLVGTSQFVNNINFVRALEGEIERTIRSLSLIENSRVHLVIPKKDLFSKSGPIPSASVMVKVRSGHKLTKDEVKGISHLVVAAVPDLQLENITIIDHNGKPFKINEEREGSFQDSTIYEYKTGFENKLKYALEDLIGQHVGRNKVKASVTAILNFDKEVISSEIYDPEGQVIRSHKSNKATAVETKNKNNVSVANNIPNANENHSINPSKTQNTQDDIVNYEISKIVKNKVIQWGEVQKLSIAVMIDDSSIIREHNKEIRIDRTEEDMSKIRSLIIAAAGINFDRGDQLELIALPFSQEWSFIDDQPFAAWSDKSQNMMRIMIFGTVAILALLLILKPTLSRLVNSKINSNKEDEIINNLNESMSQNHIKDNGEIMENYLDFSESANQVNLNDNKEKAKIKTRYNKLLEQLTATVEQDTANAVKVMLNWLHNKRQTKE